MIQKNWLIGLPCNASVIIATKAFTVLLRFSYIVILDDSDEDLKSNQEDNRFVICIYSTQ